MLTGPDLINKVAADQKEYMASVSQMPLPSDEIAKTILLMESVIKEWNGIISNHTGFCHIYTVGAAQSELAYFWEKAFRLAVAVPEYASEILRFTNEIVHTEKGGSSCRTPEWTGYYGENEQDQMSRKRRDAVERLKRLYEQHGQVY